MTRKCLFILATLTSANWNQLTKWLKDKWTVRFSREVNKAKPGEEPKFQQENNIKVSRGEENLFIWCFFLAIVQLAMDRAKA